MSKLRELSHDLGATIYFFSTDDNDLELYGDVKGLYLPEYDIIYIRDDLSRTEQENVILHELGHCNRGHIHYTIHSKMYSSKQEAEADYYMIEYRFKEWISHWDFEPEIYELKIERFMKAYEFNNTLFNLCEKVINGYCGYYETA